MTIITREPERVGRWIIERTGGVFIPEESTCIGLERNGRLVSGVLYDRFNGRAIFMTIAAEGYWATPDFLFVVFDYPFRQLGVKKALALVDSCNIKSIRLCEKLGYVLEGKIADAAPTGDQLIYTMTAAQCRWLNVVRRPGVRDGEKNREARYA